MSEKPILFSGPMIRAIREGRKTQTRRVMFKDDPRNHMPWKTPSGWQDGDTSIRCPYGQPGDRLWVRESWFRYESGDVVYRADFGPESYEGGAKGWRPSIFMPRQHSRITLEITGVRVERVQEISTEDALAEGIIWPVDDVSTVHDVFARLWDQINAKRGYSWESNPWVWVVSFHTL